MNTTVLSEIGELLGHNSFFGQIGTYKGVAYDVEASLTGEAYQVLLHLAEIGVEKAIELLPLVV